MPLWPQVAQRLLVGARPKPISSGQHGPKCQRRFAPYFLCCELTAFFLQHIHFGELCPAQQRAHFRLCNPVQFKVGLMLCKEFPAALRRLKSQWGQVKWLSMSFYLSPWFPFVYSRCCHA